MTWQRKPLEEVADFCLGKMLDQKKNRGELRPYLANINVRWGSFDLNNLREMRFEDSEDDRYGLKYGDIVMCEGGEPGRCAIWKDERPGMMVQKALHRIRPRGGLDHRFLYYAFLSKGRTGELSGLFTGATIKHLPKEKLAKAQIPIPAMATQERVAELLSSYDDLIENNRKRIALLEEAARLLYREWFVNLRFPGHEHVKVIDGVPEGWQRISPSQIVRAHIGGGWGQDEPQGNESEPAYVVRGTDIPQVFDGSFDAVGLRYHSTSALASRTLAPYDVIFEVSGGSASQPIARTLLMTGELLSQWDQKIICASFCKRFTFHASEDAAYFYFHVREHRDRGDVLVFQKESASSLKNFNFEGFMNSYRLSLPPRPLLLSFFEAVDPILRQQTMLGAQVFRLAAARDLLLPRLMNGEIAV
jgi:type I restriction enzyme S subunit